MSPLNQNNPKSRRGLTPERYGIWGPLGSVLTRGYQQLDLACHTHCWARLSTAGRVRLWGERTKLTPGGGIHPLSISYGSRHYLLRSVFTQRNIYPVDMPLPVVRSPLGLPLGGPGLLLGPPALPGCWLEAYIIQYCGSFRDVRTLLDTHTSTAYKPMGGDGAPPWFHSRDKSIQ